MTNITNEKGSLMWAALNFAGDANEPAAKHAFRM
jgi:hypothetical protein